MADPICELVSQNILTTLQGITGASAIRRGQSPAPMQDLQIVLEDGDDRYLDSQFTGKTDYEREYLIWGEVLEAETSSTAIDTRLNRLRSSIEKALLADTTRGGYARNTRIDSVLKAWDEAGNIAGILVIAIVHYRITETDPDAG